MTKNNQIIITKSITILLLFTIVYYQYWLEAYWLLAVYIPVILTLIHSYKKQDNTSTINKFFKYYTWFLILLSVIFLVGSYLYASEYYNDFSNPLAWFGDNTIINLPKIAIILLLAMLLKLNNNLDD